MFQIQKINLGAHAHIYLSVCMNVKPLYEEKLLRLLFAGFLRLSEEETYVNQNIVKAPIVEKVF